LDKIWKVACAVVYLTICILDFIVFPLYVAQAHSKFTSYEYYEKVNEIFKNDKEAVRIIVSDRNTGDWIPFSLRGGGLLHISFGAILTGSIIGRKKE
jgi:hypothetical protein